MWYLLDESFKSAYFEKPWYMYMWIFFKMWLSFIRSVISSHNKYCSLFMKRRLVFYRDVFFWFDKIWPILHGFFKIKIILISKAFIYKFKTTCKLKIRNYICLANPIKLPYKSRDLDMWSKTWSRKNVGSWW